MSTEVASKPQFDAGQLESVFIKGDISSMNEIQRIEYTRKVCLSLGLNPITHPFDFITFQGKTVLYAKKGCTDQLRAIYGISVKIVSQVIEDGILTVTAQARFPDGREDEDCGCVNVGSLKGDALANAKMKAVTKAKRRVTLSICGLGILDESELDTIKGAKPVVSLKDQKELDLQEERESLAALEKRGIPVHDKEPVTIPIKPDKITDQQYDLLFHLIEDCKTTEEQLRHYCKIKMNINSLKDIPIRYFDNLVRAIKEGFVSKTQNPEASTIEYPDEPNKPTKWFKNIVIPD